MELKSRQSYILRSILEDPIPLSLDEIVADLGIAKRTVYYDLDKINDWLFAVKKGEVIVKNGFVSLLASDHSALKYKLLRDGNYFFPLKNAAQCKFCILHFHIKI